LIEVGLRIKRRHRFNSHGQHFSRECRAKLVVGTRLEGAQICSIRPVRTHRAKLSVNYIQLG
jgi:hypothetical protein